MFKTRLSVVGNIAYILLAIIITITTSQWLWQKEVRELAEIGLNKQAFYTIYLRGLLEKTENIPPLLSTNDKIISILEGPTSDIQILEINKFLASITNMSDTSDVYIMDNKGVTLAASNWLSDHSFVGQNFSFRPYFQKAINGSLGRYYALGSTSAKRGYYFSYPIYKNSVIVGVVVVKADLDLVERNWNHLNDSIIVTDPDGIIFLTTTPNWLYKSITPVQDNIKERIIKSRRYPTSTFQPIAKNIQTEDDQELIVVSTDGKENLFLKQSISMPLASWDVHIFTDLRPATQLKTLTQITCLAIMTIAYILMYMLRQRTKRKNMLHDIEEANRINLEKLNAELETRVEDRTKQLSESNQMLKNEIIERKQVEKTLKTTRNELTHAAKLAVLGQMSAQINHELNQPLAAIRSYADNALLFLAQKRIEETESNLKEIAQLIIRMADIGKQLKLFSRKSSGQITIVPLHGVLDGAMSILNPTIRKNQIHVKTDFRPDFINVMANSVLLQQVLVNLISNAIQAMEKSPTKEISVTAIKEANIVQITICDTGSGIAKEHANHIFEPFYTTKKSGQGLGLGLSISDRIVEEIDGKLELVYGENGACFQFTLKAADHTPITNLECLEKC